MTDNIFGDPTKTNGVETTGQSDDLAAGQDTANQTLTDDHLKELVGEGKKYKTTADLVKAVQEKDSFIERIKEENKGMREDLERFQAELDKATNLEDVLDKMLASRSGEGNQSLSPDEVKKLVNTALDERQTVESQQKNFESSQKAVLDYLNGDIEKARVFIAEKAVALGMSTKDLFEISKKSPSGFTQLIGIPAGKTSVHNTPSARSSEQVNNGTDRGPETGTKEYYSKLRKENPSLYWSPKIQNQMVADASKDPEKFHGRS